MPELQALNSRQEVFCALIIKGESQSDAYRQAYQPKRASDKTIHEKASRLMAEDKVKARIAELRAPVIEEAQLTLSAHLASLKEIRDKAMEKEQLSAAVSAEVSRGKASGLYVDKIEDVTKLTREEREQRILSLVKTAKSRKSA